MHRCLFYFYIIVILHNNTLSGSFYTIAIFLFYLLFHEWVNRLFSSFFIELPKYSYDLVRVFFFSFLFFFKFVSKRQYPFDKKEKKNRRQLCSVEGLRID